MPFDRRPDLRGRPSLHDAVLAGGQAGAYRDLDYFPLCGARANVGGSFGDLWERSANMVYPTQPTGATINSSSASDTAAGTGAQRVRVVGWNQAWELEDDEIDLAGTSPVTTVKKFWRIHSSRVVRVGSGGNNAGQIDVKIDSQFASVIAITDNRSLGAHFTIPPRRSGVLLNVFATGALGGGQIDFGAARLYARFDISGPLFPLVEVQLVGPSGLPQVVPRLVLPGPADLVLRVFGSGAGSSKRMSGGFDVLLLPEEHHVPRVLPF